MSTNGLEDLNAKTSENLQTEITKVFTSEPERAIRRAPAVLAESPVEPVARLPRRIAGGFRGLGDDLDRRARDWRNMVRLLEQQRPQLESAEAERDRLFEALGRVVPEVQESGRALKALVETTKGGDVTGDLANHFAKSLSALDELESVAEALTANVLSIRSAWEQYARTVIKAQRMREDLKQD